MNEKRADFKKEMKNTTNSRISKSVYLFLNCEMRLPFASSCALSIFLVRASNSRRYPSSAIRISSAWVASTVLRRDWKKLSHVQENILTRLKTKKLNFSGNLREDFSPSHHFPLYPSLLPLHSCFPYSTGKKRSSK
jgi:hypothetical protein